MNGFSGYNQIKMYPEDEKHTSFRTLFKGVLLHGNALRIEECSGNISTGHEYNLHEHIRKTMECYTDDIAVKRRDKGDHLTDLKKVLEIMRAHQLRMNPIKSFLWVVVASSLDLL